MALDMLQNCTGCSAPTPLQAEAYICSYECTFCIDCVNAERVCPNCGGDLQLRPKRKVQSGNIQGGPSDGPA